MNFRFEIRIFELGPMGPQSWEERERMGRLSNRIPRGARHVHQANHHLCAAHMAIGRGSFIVVMPGRRKIGLSHWPRAWCQQHSMESKAGYTGCNSKD